ncbi:MAG: 3-hydroxyacyl-CoA dehydrogenase/enoyl-CoA hydratase family protein [Gammaproteobacteria bacterium]|nr:3-hydroxyacyl-CoA dehydrogenase/enoyl-CoA hydratase family protein [Gammaproteobacteria bacterium]MDJ0890402.1 3-hydroxyacyl-CoA dehydrogenase/enoyl-CoA hydratase family protein [Gammaproteobacteria bacterium]
MTQQIETVGVLGAGVMGAQLAGHLANVGVPSLLFDVSQDLAEKAIANLATLKPAPLYKPGAAELITPCSYAQHQEKLATADWVLEAVVERLDVKHQVYQTILPHLGESAILTSNTSGLPLADLVTVLPEAVRRRFMITHFFNPPRYMHLLELVRGRETSDAVYQRIADFAENVLGKGLVDAKDTPNFIANRIGIYSMMTALRVAREFGLTVEQVDKLTGVDVGRPKSATFRTADLVGLDILAHVARTSYERGEQDEEREVFQLPEILAKLIEEGRLGQKTKAGFYKKIEKNILSVSLESGEYHPQERVRFDGLRLAKGRHSVPQKISALTYSDDKAGRFFWETLARTLLYCANRIPEISDDIVSVDNAMKWGFGWVLGPFETWDAIGLQRSVLRMEKDGRKVPGWIIDMLKSGRGSFYSVEAGKKRVYDLSSGSLTDCPVKKRSIQFNLERSKGHVVQRHWSASLIDLGDGALDLEFHSVLQPVLNPIDGSMIDMLNRGLDLVESRKYRSLVIAHQGQNFCAGANLALVLGFCERQDWDGLERTVEEFQRATQRIRFLPSPVVAAPFQLTLGGGFELIAPAAHRVAAAEVYIGAVEMSVGLIPGAGGNLRLLLNLMENAGKKGRLNVFSVVQKAFETIGFAKVSMGAEDAKRLGYLLRTDTVVVNPDQLVWAARQQALEMAEEYTPPAYRDDLKLPGIGARTAMMTALKGFRAQGKISAHDEKIGQKLAYVLSGGDRAGLTKTVDEQYLLDIEREAFVSLAAEPLTQERIRFMLKKGKPLRN